MAKDISNYQTILVTGCAGFIGSKITELLLERGDIVVGVDNLNDAYSPQRRVECRRCIETLKEWRLAQIQKFPAFEFERLDITHFDSMKELFQQHDFDAVMNLAARAGVRASVENPWVYVETNIKGTLNLLELCKKQRTTSSYRKDFGVKKFLVASTSSIYGESEMPFREDKRTDFQLSPYAASKKGAESLAYTYHYLYGIDITIPRYFTVYGPAGRPDMSVFKFIYRILIEQCLGKKAQIEFQPRHPADVPATWADISKAKELLGWHPEVNKGLSVLLRRTMV